MFNRDYLNLHDVVLITTIAILVHLFVMPLYDRIGLASAAPGDGS